ncbi:hypothetical protein BRADI_3g34295v3 [Brachypodium distachyon]|uniref:WEB family protein n=1 Tax=Brachypodium distachyon TaxID=15368 RepID=I1I6G7_BRADI|nr:hypothetical protein BRADI_3g34295v3 [Brachypodium distachyon]
MLAFKPRASQSEAPNHREPPNTNSSSNSNSSSNYSRAHALAPRVSRLVKPAATGSSKQSAEPRAPSPLHNAARTAAPVSIDATPKPSPIERRSFKASPHRTTTVADKQPRMLKASELQAQLNIVQEDLRSAREHLASIDRDRAQVHGDLALTKSLADEAYRKLEDSLAAQRRAEEALELERFKSVEREQAAIELAWRKEDEWLRKHGDATKRQAQDAASLAKIAKELENAKGELAVTLQAKNSAIGRADEAEKIAEASAKKMETLMEEVTRLKSEMDSRGEAAAEIISKLRSEASELRAELQRAMVFEEKLARAEEVVEGLNVDIAYSKRAEMDSDQSAQRWKAKVAALEARLTEITSLNKSKEEALVSLTKSFDDTHAQLVQLREKMALSEREAGQYKEGFLETNSRLEVAKKEASGLQAVIDSLRSEHELLNEAHRQVINNEKAASVQFSMLAGDKARLQLELDGAREEKDKAKKAVEDLAAALRQVSSEAREAKERVLAKQSELEHVQLQMSELKKMMKDAEDKYQLVHDESNCLKKIVQRMESEAKIFQDDHTSKEAGFAEMLRRSEEEASSARSEMNKLMGSLAAAEKQVEELNAERTKHIHEMKGIDQNTMDASSSAQQPVVVDENSRLKDLLSSKEKEVLALDNQVTELRLREMAALAKAEELSKSLAEATARKAGEEEAARGAQKSKALLAKDAKDDMAQLQNKLRLVESKITEANLSAEEEKIGSLRLKETLAEKEEELLSIARENEGLRTKEAAARAKADDLAALLIEATAMKGGDQPATRSTEKQPNVFMKMMCPPMDNVVRGDHEARKNSDRAVQVLEEIKHVEMETVKQVKHERDEDVSVEANSLENSKIIEDDLSKEMRADGVDEIESSDDGDDIESQGEEGAADQMDGLLMHGPSSSFKKEQHIQKKKKKALLKKFGSMLRKKAHFTKLRNHS